jgi:fluoride exporter
VTVWTLLGVAAAGGLGAVVRYLVDSLIGRPGRRPYPLGTAVINVSGSAILGLLAGVTLTGRLPAEALLIAGSGLMGGYTTFSSASQETVELLHDGRVAAGLLHGVGMVVTAVAAAGAGLAIGLSV